MEIKSGELWLLVGPRLRTYMEQLWDFETIAQMTSSTVGTVSGWLAGQTPPGERLIRLWHILSTAGLESPELDKLPPF